MLTSLNQAIGANQSKMSCLWASKSIKFLSMELTPHICWLTIKPVTVLVCWLTNWWWNQIKDMGLFFNASVHQDTDYNILQLQMLGSNWPHMPNKANIWVEIYQEWEVPRIYIYESSSLGAFVTEDLLSSREANTSSKCIHATPIKHLFATWGGGMPLEYF